MIGYIDVEVQAANPQLPLYPIRAFVNSPSNVRVKNVPTEIGAWKITAVRIVAAYPDSSVKAVDCVAVGDTWVATIAGCSVSGRSENGFTVFASGVDENGDAVSNYVLGKGNIEILKADGTLSPDAPSYYVHLYEDEPDAPNEGDMWPMDGGYVIYQDGEAHALGGVTVDDALSDTSENPVQNKVVTAALNGKATAAQGAKADAALSRAEAEAGFTDWVWGDGVNRGQPEWDEENNRWSFDGGAYVSHSAVSSEDDVVLPTLYTIEEDEPMPWTATRTRLPTMADIPTDNAQLANGAGYATTAAMNAALALKADAASLPYALADVTPTAGAPFVLAACFPIKYTDGGSTVTIAATDAGDLDVDESETPGVAYEVSHNGTTLFGVSSNGFLYVLLDMSVTFGDPATTPSEGETQVLGFTPTAQLTDRAINAVSLSADATGITLVFPAAQTGKVRDFLVRLTIPAGDAPQIAYPEGVTFENADGSFPEINTDESAAASTLLMFTETAPAITGDNSTPARFLVKGEALKEVS